MEISEEVSAKVTTQYESGHLRRQLTEWSAIATAPLLFRDSNS